MSKTLLWKAVKRAMDRFRDSGPSPLIAELDTILEDHKTQMMERAEVSKAKEVRLAAKAADKAKAKEDAWEAGRAARFRAKWKANVPNISPPTEAEFIAMSGKTYKEFLKE